MNVIVCVKQIPDPATPGALNADNTLKRDIHLEHPAILHKMIQACLEWQRDGLCQPTSVTQSVDTYLRSNDSVGAWLDENCVRHDKASMRSSDGYNNYAKWCKDNGEHYTMSGMKFSQEMKRRGHEIKRTALGSSLTGIGLRAADSAPSSPYVDA